MHCSSGLKATTNSRALKFISSLPNANLERRFPTRFKSLVLKSSPVDKLSKSWRNPEPSNCNFVQESETVLGMPRKISENLWAFFRPPQKLVLPRQHFPLDRSFSWSAFYTVTGFNSKGHCARAADSCETGWNRLRPPSTFVAVLGGIRTQI